MVGMNLTLRLKASECDYLAPPSSEVDLLDYHAVKESLKAYNPDFVIHCAGIVGGIAANIAEPYRFCDQNLQIGMNLIRASASLGIQRLINLGSSCMYPVQAPNPIQESAILSGPLEPTNEGYALAKIAIARLAEYVSNEYRLNYKTVIPCNLYGIYDHFDPLRSHLIPGAILKIHNAMVNREPNVKIWGDGTARREFMYAGDFADFLAYALGRFDELPHYMNVGFGVDYTVNYYYSLIAEIMGYKGTFLHDASRPVGVTQKLVNIDIQKSIGWMPPTPLPVGLEQTYEYFSQECC